MIVTMRALRQGWRSLCQSKAAALRDEWLYYEAEWHEQTAPDFPMSKTDQQRKAFAFAVADFLDAIA